MKRKNTAYDVPENWKKKVKRRHSLSHTHLRKIRYALRTILYLKYKEEQRKSNKRINDLIRDDSLSYEELSKRVQKLNLELSELNSMVDYYPIGCAVCADRMNDLTFHPYRGGYLCDPCNDMWKSVTPLEDKFECDREDGEGQPRRCILCGHTDENMVYRKEDGFWYCSCCWEQVKDYWD